MFGDSEFIEIKMRGNVKSAEYLVAEGNLLMDTTALLVAVKLKLCVHLFVPSIYSLS